MTIDRLRGVLSAVGPPVTALELAEVLWLACHLDSEQPADVDAGHGSGQAAAPPTDLDGTAESALKADQAHGRAATATGGSAPVPRSELSTPESTREPGTGAVTLPTPTAPMLPEILAVQRALRPLKRRVPSHRINVVDEDATARRIAEQLMNKRPSVRPVRRPWVPVMRASEERWLSLALVMDTGPSMRLWEPLLREVREAVLRLGAFRDVRVWYLRGDGVAAAPGAAARSPASLIDPSGRQLVLVLSDCAGGHWWVGTAAPALHAWATHGPTAILQPLSERLWRRTAASPVPGVGLTQRPGAPNTGLRFAPYDVAPGAGVPVPLLEMSAEWLADWAHLVADGTAQPVSAAVTYVSPHVHPQTEALLHEQALPAAERVLRFRATATREAVRLAAYTAVSDPTLPVMRLILERLLRVRGGGRGPSHLSEVLLSGLLRVTDPRRDAYEFVEGAREALLTLLPRSESWHVADVLYQISDEIEARAANPRDVFGSDLSLPEELGDHARGHRAPFALVSLAAIRYLRQDAQLRTLNGTESDGTIEFTDTGGSSSRTVILGPEPATEETTRLFEAKVILVGEGAAGKTSLVAALAGERFISDRPITHGIINTSLTVPHPDLDEFIDLNFWDFGGQESYRATIQFYFSSRALYLVVWNARHGRGADDVESWIRRIRLRVGNGASIMIVATHSEEGYPDLDYSTLEREYSGMLVGHFEVDSMTRLGINDLRAAISRQAARLPHMGALISAAWKAARDEVLTVREPQISYQRFAEICRRNNVIGTETDALTALMHDLGLVLHYGEDDGLRDIVVLNPDWLSRAIAYVLDDRVTATAGGILEHARLRKIWQDRQDSYPARYHPYLLRLLEKFDISYRLEDDETRSLIPQLVPHERPPLPWQRGSAPVSGIRRLALNCRLAEPAPGLIPWLTARHHRASTGRHWRRGVFLRHPIAAYASEAILELVTDTNLALEVRAPSPDFYFHMLRDSIQGLISSRWPGLRYELLIPCPNRQGRDGQPCQGQFLLDGLLRVREAEQASSVSCLECANVWDVSLLLTGFAAAANDVSTSIEQLRDRLAQVEGGLISNHGKAAESADILRRVQRLASDEVSDCPWLFTIARKKAGRLGFGRDRYQLTLWCEHPGHEHPWNDARYEIDPPREWFARIASYAELVLKALSLVTPLVSAQESLEGRESLEAMRAIVNDLPTGEPTAPARSPVDWTENAGRLTAAEGEALRALRRLVFEKDPSRAFGGIRRVQTPAGDLLWVCPHHYPEYDPGLPVIP